MGREVKRVPLDFSWPRNVIWKGYQNPYRPIECRQCDGSGLNAATKKLSDDWYTHLRTDGKEGWGRALEQEDVQALIDAGRLMDFTRRPRTPEQAEMLKKQAEAGGSGYWLKESNGYIPTAEEVNQWANQGFGHDSINQWVCVEARAKRLGIYGSCELCSGQGHYWCDDKYEALWDSWETIAPPFGDGYQLWETTTEGSPISPVFATPEALARWLVDTNASAFGNRGASYEQWLAVCEGAYAPSAVVKDGRIMSGVEAAGK